MVAQATEAAAATTTPATAAAKSREAATRLRKSAICPLQLSAKNKRPSRYGSACFATRSHQRISDQKGLAALDFLASERGQYIPYVNIVTCITGFGPQIVASLREPVLTIGST